MAMPAIAPPDMLLEVLSPPLTIELEELLLLGLLVGTVAVVFEEVTVRTVNSVLSPVCPHPPSG